MNTTILSNKLLPAHTQLGYFQRVELKEQRRLEAFLSLGFCGDNYLTKHPDSAWITHTKTDKRQGKLFGEYLYKAWAERDVLVGCRFTPKHCHYVVIDLDSKGRYHNLKGLEEVKAALEQIGLVRSILVRSSHSNGWHLYLPLGVKGKAGEVYGTDRTAWAVRCALEDAGLEIAPGHLEIFPNTRSSRNALYNGHRLPLQPLSGSYVLDDEGMPLHNDITVFASSWQLCAEGQDHETFRAATKKNGWERAPKGENGVKASGDDVQLLSVGWTGGGQSNDLMLAAVRKVTSENPQLNEEAMAQLTEDLLRSLPGFDAHCNHKHEIKSWSTRSIRAWGHRSAASGSYIGCGNSIYSLVTSSHRKGSSRQRSTSKRLNKERSEDAQGRIQEAAKAHPYQEGVTIRSYMETLRKEAGMSQATLSKYKHLWHPSHKAG